MDTFDSMSISGKSCFFDCRAIRTRPSLGRGGVEAVEFARPVHLPPVWSCAGLLLPRRGQLSGPFEATQLKIFARLHITMAMRI